MLTCIKNLICRQNQTSLERELEVTQAGRNANFSESLKFGGLRKKMMDREEQVTLTTNINIAVTDAITFIGTFKWDIRYCQFLGYITRDIQKIRMLEQGTDQMLAAIDTLAPVVGSILDYAEAIKARLDIQLSIVSTLHDLFFVAELI